MEAYGIHNYGVLKAALSVNIFFPKFIFETFFYLDEILSLQSFLLSEAGESCNDLFSLLIAGVCLSVQSCVFYK